METLTSTDIYTSDVNPDKSVNPKRNGVLWVNYKTGTIFTCQDNTKDKNVWGSSWDSIYPVGSLFITMSEIDPNVHFGGVWEKETGDKTIWLSDTGAGEELSPGLPNLVGGWGGSNGASDGWGAVRNWSGRERNKTGNWGSRGFCFNASWYNSIYKDDCNTVQPPAIRVYCWIRKA